MKIREVFQNFKDVIREFGELKKCFNSLKEDTVELHAKVNSLAQNVINEQEFLENIITEIHKLKVRQKKIITYSLEGAQIPCIR